jgi:hypothetical protein
MTPLRPPRRRPPPRPHRPGFVPASIRSFSIPKLESFLPPTTDLISGAGAAAGHALERVPRRQHEPARPDVHRDEAVGDPAAKSTKVSCSSPATARSRPAASGSPGATTTAPAPYPSATPTPSSPGSTAASASSARSSWA